MPHLDAAALTEDPKGLEFLAEILDVPADHPVPRWTAPEAVVPLSEGVIAKVRVRTRRKRIAMVPEAA